MATWQNLSYQPGGELQYHGTHHRRSDPTPTQPQPHNSSVVLHIVDNSDSNNEYNDLNDIDCDTNDFDEIDVDRESAAEAIPKKDLNESGQVRFTHGANGPDQSGPNGPKKNPEKGGRKTGTQNPQNQNLNSQSQSKPKAAQGTVNSTNPTQNRGPGQNQNQMIEKTDGNTTGNNPTNGPTNGQNDRPLSSGDADSYATTTGRSRSGADSSVWQPETSSNTWGIWGQEVDGVLRPPRLPPLHSRIPFPRPAPRLLRLPQ